MAKYRVGQGPLDKLWFVINMAKGTKVYIQAVLQLSDALDQALYQPVQPPKPKPLKVESERADGSIR